MCMVDRLSEGGGGAGFFKSSTKLGRKSRTVLRDTFGDEGVEGL